MVFTNFTVAITSFDRFEFYNWTVDPMMGLQGCVWLAPWNSESRPLEDSNWKVTPTWKINSITGSAPIPSMDHKPLVMFIITTWNATPRFRCSNPI